MDSDPDTIELYFLASPAATCQPETFMNARNLQYKSAKMFQYLRASSRSLYPKNLAARVTVRIPSTLPVNSSFTFFNLDEDTQKHK